ncbi:MAG: PQQ-binding-like beta-propeller repeat protein [Actinomycetota bacterium]
MGNRRLLAALIVVVLVAAGVVTAVAVTRTTAACSDGFERGESPLQPVALAELDDTLTIGAPGVDGPRWALRANFEVSVAIVDVGGWAAYVDAGTIVRVDEDGGTPWTWVPDDLRLVRTVVLDDDLLAVTWSGLRPTASGLVVLDADGGIVSCQRFADAPTFPAPDGEGGAGVVVAVGDGDAPEYELVRTDADGTERWRAPAPGWSAEVTPTEDPGVAVTATSSYLTVRDDSTAGVQALDDSTGEPRWRLGSDDLRGAFVGVLGEQDGTVFLAGTDEDRSTRIHAVDASSGRIAWSTDVVDGWRDLVGGTAAVMDDLVVIRSRDTTFALDATSGEERWRIDQLQVSAPFLPRPIERLDAAGSLALLPGPGSIVDLTDGSTISWIADDPIGSGVAEVGGVIIHDVESLPVGSGHLVLGWDLDVDRLALPSAPS